MITFSFTVARPSVTVKADGVLSSGITVLTGQSGSGKSTFIKCIAGLVKPTTGSIQYDETIWVDRDKKSGYLLKNVKLAICHKVISYFHIYRWNIILPIVNEARQRCVTAY